MTLRKRRFCASSAIFTHMWKKGTFRSYLFRIAMNVINDHFHHMCERDMQPLEEENIRDAVSVSEDIHERMLVEHLLAQLPSYQRDVLVLKYQYG